MAGQVHGDVIVTVTPTSEILLAQAAGPSFASGTTKACSHRQRRPPPSDSTTAGAGVSSILPATLWATLLHPRQWGTAFARLSWEHRIGRWRSSTWATEWLQEVGTGVQRCREDGISGPTLRPPIQTGPGCGSMTSPMAIAIDLHQLITYEYLKSHLLFSNFKKKSIFYASLAVLLNFPEGFELLIDNQSSK